MKAFYRKSLFAAALAVTLSSCEKKEENIVNLSEEKTSSISEVVYPLNGNDMSNSILPKKENLPNAILKNEDLINYPGVNATVIDLVCDDYLNGTTKLDLFNLKDDVYGTSIKNNELTIVFTSGADLKGEGYRKLSNGPKGWWTHWNYSPYTESEYPSVLFAEDKNGRVINSFNLQLSKAVTAFGFEVAPSVIGKDMKVTVAYQEEEYYRQPIMFYVEQTISSPSGARLIAVKSDIPFRRLAITTAYGTGLAISNIRYALPKK